MLDEKLLAILVCPEDKGELWYFSKEEFLYNPRLHRKYMIVDNIPIMLIDEAESVDDAGHKSIVEQAETLGLTSS